MIFEKPMKIGVEKKTESDCVGGKGYIARGGTCLHNFTDRGKSKI